MFVASRTTSCIALDAKNGKVIWRYKRELPEGFGALHKTNRGVALWGDKVYFSALDALLVALDAKTGKVAWESKTVADWQQGYYITLAPLVVNGKVMVGVSGGEFGVRGFVLRTTRRPASRCGRPTPYPGPASPVTTPGRATAGSAAVARSG